jgi:hypothetical protein
LSAQLSRLVPGPLGFLPRSLHIRLSGLERGICRRRALLELLLLVLERFDFALNSPPPELSRDHALELICESLKAIKYSDDQAAHESHIAPGLLVVSEEGLALADEVNRRKRALASILRAMQGRTEIGVIDQRTGERGPRPLREVALESFFFRRLHHWQATRELVVLRESTTSIGTPTTSASAGRHAATSDAPTAKRSLSSYKRAAPAQRTPRGTTATSPF